MDAVTGWLQKGRDDEEEDERAKLDQRLTQRGNGDVGMPKALTQDPFLALDQMGYRERPSGLSYRMLNEMGRKCPPVTAIIQTRVNQVAACADPQPDDHSVGVKIVLADRRAKMTPDLQREGDRILDWVLHCGNPDVKRRRFNLGHYLRASTADSLILDQLNTEIVNDRKGRPSWWHAVDASTIRLVDDLDDDDDSEETVRYVQVYEDTIVAEFSEREMLFGIRNPRTDIRVGGYGFSELEMLVTIVTALLWAQDYNSAFFKQGTVAKGILNFKGAIPDKELISFRRQWYAMISGIANAWRTPVVNSEDLQWINMQQSSREMEFAAFIDWLLKVACGVFLIAPEEIGFQFGNGGQTSALSEGSQGDKLKYSKDKGLVPLVKFHAEQLNQIVRRVDPRFRAEFAGINSRTAEDLIKLQKDEVSTIKTIDEARMERGMKPLSNGRGDIILNPVFQAATQAAQAQAAGGAPAGGAPPGQGFDRGGLEDGDQDDQDDDGEDPYRQGGEDDDGPEEKEIQKSAAPKRKRRVLNLEVDL